MEEKHETSSLLPWIVGSVVVGGIVYFLTREEPDPEYRDEDQLVKIKKLRSEIQRERRRRKAYLKRMSNVSKTGDN